MKPRSGKDVKHPGKHSSVHPPSKYLLSAKYVLGTVLASEDTAFMGLIFRRGWRTINTDMNRKIRTVRGMKNNNQDGSVENYWDYWGICFRDGWWGCVP